jgi:hypothetical protein
MDPLQKFLEASANGTLTDLLGTMNGPDFLVVYAAWFALTFGAVFLIRLMYVDDASAAVNDFRDIFISGIGAVFFLGLGMARFVVGSAHGMRQWDHLYLMMLAGGVCFLLRAHLLSPYSGTGSCSSCSIGGGCGGGGGGGCGGCGGH